MNHYPAPRAVGTYRGKPLTEADYAAHWDKLEPRRKLASKNRRGRSPNSVEAIAATVEKARRARYRRYAKLPARFTRLDVERVLCQAESTAATTIRNGNRSGELVQVSPGVRNGNLGGGFAVWALAPHVRDAIEAGE